jgi:hypothetical protein
MSLQKQEKYNLGNGIVIKKGNDYILVYRDGGALFQETIDWREKTPEFRMFIVNLITKYNAQKTKTSACFNISRQSIDNWIASFEREGINGLVNSTKNGVGRPLGNKARTAERERKEERIEIQNLQPSIFDAKAPDLQDVMRGKHINKNELPHSEEIKGANNRYAGQIIIQMLLIHKWSWFNFIIGFFGKGFNIFQVFLLMAGKNIRSIEQLKNLRKKEGGNILGIGKLPTPTEARFWFKNVASMKISDKLKNNFLAWQLKNALAGTQYWFTDGHVLPYSGKQKLRKMFNTKRRLAEPGRTNMITTDFTGRVVEYDIQEGQGNLRARILNLHSQWHERLSAAPIQVFDREGHGNEFYYKLIDVECPFVCWEKNMNKKKIAAYKEADFDDEFSFNDTKYKYIKNTKSVTFDLENKNQDEKVSYELERYYILNTKTGKRTSVLANNVGNRMDDTDCIVAILNRWGASENTNKYLNNKHPLHYQPGFKYNESKNQVITNKEVAETDKKIKKEEKELKKKAVELSSREKTCNKDGNVRSNDVYSRLKKEINVQQEKIKSLKEKKNKLPKKINLSGLEDYESFKVIDNEAKNLFDFVTIANWNARKEGVDILRRFYPNENDIVDLYYAITNCQGKIDVTKNQVTVTLEPLEQKCRRHAQIDFCNYLNGLNIKTPTKKQFILKVKK